MATINQFVASKTLAKAADSRPKKRPAADPQNPNKKRKRTVKKKPVVMPSKPKTVKH